MENSTTVPTSTTTPAVAPVTNTQAPAVQNAEGLYDIGGGVMVDQETYDIIKGADQKAIKPTRNLIPEIKVVATDKQVLDLGNILGQHVAKGMFVAITYDADGNKIHKLMPPTFQAVIIKNTNAYSLYDEVEGKSTYYTNEYEYGVQHRVMVKEAETNKVMFDGNQKNVKEYLLKYFPGKTAADGRETHQFSFRNIIYVVLSSEINPEVPGSGVYRLMLSHTSLDGVNQFKETISGDPMKYLAEFSTTAKMAGGSNLSYPLGVKLVGGPEVLAKLGVLGTIAKMKRDLDEFVLEAQNHFFNGELRKQEELAPATEQAPASLPQPIKPVEPAVTADVAASIFGWV